jgi:hypothetical protein
MERTEEEAYLRFDERVVALIKINILISGKCVQTDSGTGKPLQFKGVEDSLDATTEQFRPCGSSDENHHPIGCRFCGWGEAAAHQKDHKDKELGDASDDHQECIWEEIERRRDVRGDGEGWQDGDEC